MLPHRSALLRLVCGSVAERCGSVVRACVCLQESATRARMSISRLSITSSTMSIGIHGSMPSSSTPPYGVFDTHSSSRYAPGCNHATPRHAQERGTSARRQQSERRVSSVWCTSHCGHTHACTATSSARALDGFREPWAHAPVLSVISASISAQRRPTWCSSKTSLALAF